MAVGFSNTNKPINPRGNDASPKGYNRASLFSGKALDFDGVNDSIDISNFSLNGYTAFSICFYKTSDFNNGMIFSSADNISDGVNIYQISPGYFRARLNGVNATDTTLKVSDEEGFFVFTYDGTNAKWYYQAQNIGSGTTSQTFAIANTTSTIGRQSFASVQYLNGDIAGFKIFNTALTAAQVADLYNNPEKVVPTGVDNTALKLFLPMQEGAGTTAYDGSGNGNHGAVSGASWLHGIGAPVSQTAVIDWNKGSNLQLKSEDLTSAGGWLFDALTTSADQTTAPDGQSTADELTETTTNSNHWMFSTGGILTTTSGLDYTFSVFAKKGDGNAAPDILQLSFRSAGHGSNLYANFNLSTGAVTASSGGTASIVAHSNGWYRLIFTAAATASASGSGGVIAFTNNNATATRGPSYVGDTNANVFVWGASLTQSSSADSYVRVDLTAQTSEVLLPQGLTTGRDITGVNLFENVRKQGALNLDGNSWAEVHDNASLDVTTGLTLESWVYFDGSTNTAGILDKYHYSVNKRSYDLRRDTSGNVQFTISSNGADNLFLSYTGSQISTGWHHVLATYDQVNQKLYVDGVLNNSASATISIYNSDKPVTIGVLDPAVSSSIFNSPIAQPRIYNRALTASEVLRNYNSGKNTYTND